MLNLLRRDVLTVVTDLRVSALAPLPGGSCQGGAAPVFR